jgi:hypothetical protein
VNHASQVGWVMWSHTLMHGESTWSARSVVRLDTSPRPSLRGLMETLPASNSDGGDRQSVATPQAAI